MRGNVSISLKAVAGPIARSTRESGDNLRERISTLVNDFQTGNVSLKQLDLKVTSEKRELLDKKKKIKYPYTVVQESLEKLEILSKNIRIKERERAR